MRKLPLVTCGMVFHVISASAIVFHEDFSEPVIDSSVWTIKTSSPGNWGASITADHALELTNSFAAGESRVTGFASLVTDLTAFAAPFQPVLSNSAGIVTWSFNLAQARDNPAGFSGRNYGMAMVLGATSDNFQQGSQGYAVVLGNQGTPDPIKLVSFSDGLSSLGSNTGPAIIEAAAPLDDPGASAMSIEISYDPFEDKWSLFGRLDGSGFADPAGGVLSPLGEGIDSTFTDTELSFFGAYWQGSTAQDQTARFDNFTVTVMDGMVAVPEPPFYGAAGASLLLLAAGRRFGRANRQRRGGRGRVRTNRDCGRAGYTSEDSI